MRNEDNQEVDEDEYGKGLMEESRGEGREKDKEKDR